MQLQSLINIRRDLHQIPELGFQETKTQAYLLEYIASLPQQHLEVKTWRTGILVKVAGTNPYETIAYRADMDGLPIQEQTDYSFQSVHSGNMHACGHDFHMTIAIGALTNLATHPAEQNVLFLFQPAEESPGGALSMMESEEMKAWWPDKIFALHIAPELPIGTISSREGLLFANTSELFMDFKGKGGHAAFPHMTKDMVVAASHLIVGAQQIVARNVDPLDSAVLTFGKMTAGHVQNGIAETARLEGTMRTFLPETMERLKQRVEALVEGNEMIHDCSITIDYGSNYYQVYNSGNLVESFRHIVEQQDYVYQEARPAMTGEDFGYMLRDIPGFMFWLGVDSPHGLHHNQLQPKEEALRVGVDVVEATIRNLK
ncbi:N-acetyldiaminopimelate deacetylase [Pontibacillus litoralis]|uniref:N-acetyldiaminopimelate deacetylase n=1 Tax=Pontibacillus litoralis JSM 072002 TaxID=1385512 RepID=A0A0A5G6P9_9BACI|nr:N-acetyldiaminopimelate deacetylase [Pontibacillus litoralis]KGX88806.1 N-acetyldiaminopimelate deacetylase [Pontibacillus litoralis JSM 072002]